MQLTAEKRAQLTQHIGADDNASLHQILNLAQEAQLFADAHNQLLLLLLLLTITINVSLLVQRCQRLVDKHEAQLLALGLAPQTLHLGAQFGEHAHDLVQHRVVRVGQLEMRELLVRIDRQRDGRTLHRRRDATGGAVVALPPLVVGVERVEQSIVRVEELAELA